MYKKDSLTKALLLTLEKTIDGTVRLNDYIHHSGYYALGGGWDYPLKKSDLAQTIKRLREKGFVNTFDGRDFNKIVVKLTEAGKDYLLVIKPEEEIEWDGIWRIVIFDIPENKRLVRDVLRNRLKLWGFKPWQQSVWASKKNITKKLRALIKELEIEDWVLVIESTNIGNSHFTQRP